MTPEQLGLWEECVQALGTITTMAGLLVIAPYQAGRSPRDLGRAIARLWKRLRHGRPQVVVRGAFGAATGNLTASVYGRVGVRDDASTEEKIRYLLHAVDGIHDEIAKVRSEAAGRNSEINQQIAQIEEGHAALTQHIDQQARDAEHLNARGFPIAILGAFLAGVPFWLVGWGWIPLYLFTITVVVLGVRRSLAALRDGWKSLPALES
ncbi:hypothetical protein ACFO6V_07195 [Promicromonospora alba]|uniref:Uncharacterized protein n=1 Tax=Promicromonospora alba TaxID=1616110 RepID=A0ABV9HEG8_9MICO